jgi:chromate reductase, NAD(P)H dehydrogenase (quinone)
MITIICGTNRPNSTTRRLADYYLSRLTAHNAEANLLDLHDLPADFITSALYGNAGKNAAFNELVAIAEAADKLVFIVPEYNYSIPGALKAFIDGLPYPGGIRHKKAALLGLGAGAQGGAVALSHLTDILHYLGTTVLPVQPRLALINQHFSRAGEFTQPLYPKLIEEQIELLLTF